MSAESSAAKPQRWGVTNALSQAGPTPADIRLNDQFMEELKQVCGNQAWRRVMPCCACR